MGYLNKILYNVGLATLGFFGGLYFYSAIIILANYDVATDVVAQVALVDLISLVLIIGANVVCEILAKRKMNDELRTYCVLIVNAIMGFMLFTESVILTASESTGSSDYIAYVIQVVLCALMFAFAVTSLILSFYAKSMVKPLTFVYFGFLLLISVLGFVGAIMMLSIPSILAFIALIAHAIIFIVAFALSSESSINLSIKIKNKYLKKPVVKTVETSDVEPSETDNKPVVTFEKVKEAKMALDNNIITEEEYNKIKEEYLKGMSSK